MWPSVLTKQSRRQRSPSSSAVLQEVLPWHVPRTDRPEQGRQGIVPERDFPEYIDLMTKSFRRNL